MLSRQQHIHLTLKQTLRRRGVARMQREHSENGLIMAIINRSFSNNMLRFDMILFAFVLLTINSMFPNFCPVLLSKANIVLFDIMALISYAALIFHRSGSFDKVLHYRDSIPRHLLRGFEVIGGMTVFVLLASILIILIKHWPFMLAFKHYDLRIIDYFIMAMLGWGLGEAVAIATLRVVVKRLRKRYHIH